MRSSVLEPRHEWLHGTEKKPWRHSSRSVTLGELSVSQSRLANQELSTRGFLCECRMRSIPETLAFLERHDIGISELATRVLDNSFAEQRRGFGNVRFVHRTPRQLCIRRRPTYKEFLQRIEGSPDYKLVMPHQVIDMMGLPRGNGPLRTQEPAEYYRVAMRPVAVLDNTVKRSCVLMVSGNGPALHTDEINDLISLDTAFLLAMV